jgi:hypothetical protein
MLKAFLKRQAQQVSYRLGFRSVPIAPLDLRQVTNDAIHAAYLAGRRDCLMEVPLADCRDKLGFPFASTTLQPFVRTVRQYLEEKSLRYCDSALKEYFDDVQPRNLWELLSLSEDPNPDLLTFPPFALVMPWDATSLEKKRRSRTMVIRRENARRGANLGIEHGAKVGPVSIEKGQLEFRALTRLTESILSQGYIRNDGPRGDIRGWILINRAGDVRYVVRSGKHRIAVLTALGFESVPLRICFARVPRLSEVDRWPHVIDGLFTREQAEVFSQRVFDGCPPKTAIPASWLACEPHTPGAVSRVSVFHRK